MEPLSVLYLTSSNASYKDLATGQARWTMDPVLSFPTGAKLKLTLHSMSYTNFFINISVALGNNTFFYTDDVAVPNKYTVTIPSGSYNVSDLSDAINSGIVNNTHPDGLIVLIPDFSTNKVQFNISAAGWQVTFPAGSPFALLGTNLNQTIPAGALTIGAYSELAPNVATFNSILNIYVHSNLTNASVFNGRQSDVIGTIIPTASIGSVQDNKEFNLIWIPCNNLGGSSVNEIQVRLTNQAGVPLNLSDDFSVVIIISMM
jgi:hypothetical protein